MIKQEHNKHCEEIAEKLDRIANYELYYCSECCEEFTEEEITEDEICPKCGSELDQVSMYEYFDDVLDIKICCDIETFRNKDPERIDGAKLMIACGGPNIYINTITGTVDLYWWSEEGHADLSSDAVSEIDAFVSEMLFC